VVFQDFKLLTTRTVFENVAFPLEIQGRKRYEISKKVYQSIKQVGLEHKLQRHPLELSGGEQQRVAIARALVVDPLVLLADEPTGNLDSRTSDGIYRLLHQLHETRGLTMVIVTHSEALASRLDRVIHMEDGRIRD
jgi:cell division transport system ATP-binding protein